VGWFDPSRVISDSGDSNDASSQPEVEVLMRLKGLGCCLIGGFLASGLHLVPLLAVFVLIHLLHLATPRTLSLSF